jgi:hypothetical protein
VEFVPTCVVSYLNVELYRTFSHKSIYNAQCNYPSASRTSRYLVNREPLAVVREAYTALHDTPSSGLATA